MADHRTHPSIGGTRDQVVALIDRMPEKMQLKLLRFLKAKLPKHITGGLVVDKRTDSRRMCLIGVDYQIDGKSYYGFILDISAFGVFIDSDTSLDTGLDVHLDFTLPRIPQSFKVRGKIVWSGSQGFGVKFDSLTTIQEAQIRSFAEEEARVYTIIS
jgi:Tfp pilus assembly protein PilZ